LAIRFSTIRSNFAASTLAKTLAASMSIFRPLGRPRDDSPDELGEVGVLELDPHPAVAEPVDVEEVVEEALEATCLVGDEVDHLLAAVVSERRPALAQRDGESEDRPVSGVRSSCDTAERMFSRTCSTRSRSVMSCAVPTMRSGWPARSTITRPRPWTTRSVPSSRTTRWVHVERAPLRERLRRWRARGPGRPDGCGRGRLVVELAALRLEVVDAVELVRPRDAVAGDVPFPAADVGEGLRLGEARRRLAERRGGGVALRDRGAEREQADRGDREQALQDLHRDRLVVPPSGTFSEITPATPKRRHGEARRHRAELREAHGGPEEEREEEVGVAPEPAEEDRRAEAGQERRVRAHPRAGVSSASGSARGSPRRG
jgi:hypothetical protein